MKRILIPVDGSRHALHAVQALLEARRYDPVAQVELLNVQVPLQAGKIGRGLTQEEIDAYHLRESRDAARTRRAAALGGAALHRAHRDRSHRRNHRARGARYPRRRDLHGLARPGLGSRAADGFGGHQGPAPDGLPVTLVK